MSDSTATSLNSSSGGGGGALLLFPKICVGCGELADTAPHVVIGAEGCNALHLACFGRSHIGGVQQTLHHLSVAMGGRRGPSTTASAPSTASPTSPASSFFTSPVSPQTGWKATPYRAWPSDTTRGRADMAAALDLSSPSSSPYRSQQQQQQQQQARTGDSFPGYTACVQRRLGIEAMFSNYPDATVDRAIATGLDATAFFALHARYGTKIIIYLIGHGLTFGHVREFARVRYPSAVEQSGMINAQQLPLTWEAWTHLGIQVPQSIGLDDANDLKNK